MSRRLAGVDPSLIRPALAGLVPYEPGKPVEEVQRELGLERVVKLASNEGPYGPFPSAQEAMARAALELNRYPDGGAYRLRQALAERHGVRFEEVTVCAGADAVIGFTVQATLDPGDEVVTGWPSFASYVLDPLKVGAVPVQVPLRDERLDLDAMLDAIGPRTKLVFVAAPNNPTGTTSTRDELDAYFARVPAHVLTVLDQAYFEYIDDPDYPDGIEEYAKAGHRVLVLRTFSKIYGLAGSRVGYGVGPEEVVTAIGKVRRAFDVNSAAQEAALASVGDEAELARRRGANRDAMTLLEDALRAHGLEPAGPAVANFLFVRVGDAAGLNEALLRRGVIVRPLGAFGAPDALRITAGTPDEIGFLAEALSALAPAARPRPLRGRGGGIVKHLRYPPAGRREALVDFMRTTLKRGLGRAAPPDEDGRTVLPPGTPSPVNVYRQPDPPRRRFGRFGTILVWVGICALVLTAGAAGGGYLLYHESVAEITDLSPGAKQAQRRLDAPPSANQPAIALVIGYDKRATDGQNDPSRSDTMMLVRADPQTDSMSLLSFPRDMVVEIHCPGRGTRVGKINEAYVDCGEQGSLQTVKALTGLPINYLVTVNFRGFRQIVDRQDGVWLDVDRRYFNDRGGPFGYATIDLQPGYQLLSGRQALSYVRYRHTDSDLYRVARQQQFVRAFKSQMQEQLGLTTLLKLVNTITKNVEVAQGGGAPVDGDTVFSYARFAFELPRGRVFQTRIEGLEGFAELTTDSSNITRAVQTFSHPDVASSEKATAVALGEKIKQRVPAPRNTTVTVLNGNGVPGSASTAGFLLGERGYQILTPPNGLPANAPNYSYFRTEVYYSRSAPAGRESAQRVANLFGSAETKPLPRAIAPLSNGSALTVVVGKTFHESLAPGAIDQTPRREKANVVFAPSAARDLLRERRRRVGFPLMVPSVIERSSWIDSERPLRIHWMDEDEKHKGLRLVYKMGSNEYWGVQMTDWEDAPVLADKSHTRRIKGRIYDLYYNGPKLHMVVLRTKHGRYWVINTLLDRLSNETMLAIAKGLRPLPRARR